MTNDNDQVLQIMQQATENSTKLGLLYESHNLLAKKVDDLAFEVREQQRMDDSLNSKFTKLQDSIGATNESVNTLSQSVDKLRAQIVRIWIAVASLALLMICLSGAFNGELIGKALGAFFRL